MPLTACTNTMQRTVYNEYQGGRLVAVRPYYATEITYHPNGMLKQVTHARRGEQVSAGVAERIDADLNDMGRPYRVSTDGATLPGATSGLEGDWSNGYYAYDGAGNIKKLLKASDPLKLGDDTFTYDKVSRLAQAKVATGVSTFALQNYVYDAWGNLTSYGGQPRAVVGATNHLYDASYDAAGNQTGWLWNTGLSRYTYIYDYDRLNQLRYVNGPDGQHRVLAYDASGERIVERNLTAGTTTFNLRGLDGALLREVELKAGAYEWVKDYIYRDGQLLASQHRTEGHQHHALSHLGTTRMLTNRCGERVKRYELFPYGDTITAPANDTETRRFTGHQRDLGSLTNTTDDLEYMHARYYGVKMGRFLALDLVGGRPRSPLSWNRYAYGRSNPHRFLDPDGLAVREFKLFAEGPNRVPVRARKEEAADVNTLGLQTKANGWVLGTNLEVVFDEGDNLSDYRVEREAALLSPTAELRGFEKESPEDPGQVARIGASIVVYDSPGMLINSREGIPLSRVETARDPRSTGRFAAVFEVRVLNKSTGQYDPKRYYYAIVVSYTRGKPTQSQVTQITEEQYRLYRQYLSSPAE